MGEGRKVRQDEASTIVYWALGSGWWLCGEKINAVFMFGCAHFFKIKCLRNIIACPPPLWFHKLKTTFQNLK